MMSQAQIFLSAVILTWLVVCMAFDLRTRQVPAVLTLVPLAAAAIVRLILGGWPIVFQVAALVLISDLRWPKYRIPLACCVSALAFLASPEAIFTILVILTVWVQWDVGATGGADVKIIISLVLLFADGLIFIPVVLAGGIQGLVGLIAKQKSIPFTVSIVLGTAAWLWLKAGLI